MYLCIFLCVYICISLYVYLCISLCVMCVFVTIQTICGHENRLEQRQRLNLGQFISLVLITSASWVYSRRTTSFCCHPTKPTNMAMSTTTIVIVDIWYFVHTHATSRIRYFFSPPNYTGFTVKMYRKSNFRHQIDWNCF